MARPPSACLRGHGGPDCFRETPCALGTPFLHFHPVELLILIPVSLAPSGSWAHVHWRLPTVSTRKTQAEGSARAFPGQAAQGPAWGSDRLLVVLVVFPATSPVRTMSPWNRGDLEESNTFYIIQRQIVALVWQKVSKSVVCSAGRPSFPKHGGKTGRGIRSSEDT